MLGNRECAEHLAFAIFITAVILATKTELVAILIGVAQQLVLVKATAEAISAEERFILQAVDVVFRQEIIRNEGTGLYDREYDRSVRVGQVDIWLGRCPIRVRVAAVTNPAA